MSLLYREKLYKIIFQIKITIHDKKDKSGALKFSLCIGSEE